MVIPEPTLALAKVKTGLPPKITSFPDSTPFKVDIPVAVAAVVSSYTLSLPVIPVMVNSFAVMSPESVGCVSV